MDLTMKELLAEIKRQGEQLASLKEVVFAQSKLCVDKGSYTFEELDAVIDERRYKQGELRIDNVKAKWESIAARGEATKQEQVSNMTADYVILRGPKGSIASIAGSVPNGAKLMGMSVGQELELDQRGGFVLEAVYRPKSKVLPQRAENRAMRRGTAAARRGK
jgi:hypothetical protein